MLCPELVEGLRTAHAQGAYFPLRIKAQFAQLVVDEVGFTHGSRPFATAYRTISPSTL
jgi:hypothetical protein